MSEPVNPYAPPSLPAGDETERRGPPPRIENRFADAFATGTRLLLGNFLLVTVIVMIVWLPINLWLSYYELYFIEEDDFRSYLRMVRLMEGLFGVLGVGAVTAIGAVQLSGQSPSLNRAFGESFSQWGRFIFGGFVANLLLGLGLLCLIVPGLYVMACVGYLVPVFIVERMGIMEAIQQCFAVGKRRFWFSLGLMVSTITIQFVAGIVMGAVALAFSMLPMPERFHWVVNAVASLPADFVGAWCSLVILAAYFRLREEKPSAKSESYVPA